MILSLILMSFRPSGSNTLSLSNIKKELVLQDIKWPGIVLRQIIVETGWLNCTNCCLNKNNLFGFQVKGKYLSYATWKDSIKYYKRWQTKWYKGGNYYDFLNCLWKHKNGVCARYATNPMYTTILKNIKIDGIQ